MAWISLIVAGLAGANPTLVLSPGTTTITKSCSVIGGSYNRFTEGDSPAILIKGDNLVVDFKQASLEGSPKTSDPDQRKGIGLVVEGNNVTIKNLRMRGYKVGVLAKNTKNLMLLECDLSDQYRPRLLSTPEREDLSDWMSYHQNEKGEWAQKGAGIYLDGCDGFKLRNVRVERALNGVLLNRCNSGTIINSRFSFLSGVGIGLYRSSGNVVMHNQVDWCVRGYSHGVYNRGQDSAGILVYEQSNKNVFAYNSVTHGGDGFFLWAGQSTMDSGQGGCNDNLLYGNDFSHSPTNGIEATFSRNRFVNNLIQECWHGIWGGYSYESPIVGNTLSGNGSAISIEHGQNISVVSNRFSGNAKAMEIWERADQPKDWGYAKARDTQSRDYDIRNNVFENTAKMVFDLRGVHGIKIQNNTFRANLRLANDLPLTEKLIFANNDIRANRDPSVARLKDLAVSQIGQGVNRVMEDVMSRPKPQTMESTGNSVVATEGSTREYLGRFSRWNPMEETIQSHNKKYWVKPYTGGQNPFLKPGTVRGRRYILMDEWGPYDFRRPFLCKRSERSNASNRVIRFEVLGPRGRWSASSLKGATLSASSGTVPGFVEATIPTSGKLADVSISLNYRGSKCTDIKGNELPAGVLIPFGWSFFNVRTNWDVSWFNYDAKTQDPRTQYEAFQKVVSKWPIASEKTDRLSYDWWNSPAKGIGENHFTTIATTKIDVTPGNYVLEVSADNGVRLYLDDNLIVDEWKYSGPTTYTRSVKLTGTHRLRIEHFELDGFAQLKFNIRKG